MYIYVLGMNITTNDNSLAWTLSDNTAGSGKQKRGAKVKVAQQSQDVVTSSITKYLGDSAKFKHSNTARQLSLQEEQLKLEQRKMALFEKEHADRQEYGNNYGNIMIGKDQSCDWQGSRYDERQGYRYDERQGYRNDDRQGYRNDDIAMMTDRDIAMMTDRDIAMMTDRDIIMMTDRDIATMTDRDIAMMTDRDIAMMTDRDTVMAVVVAAATMIDRQRKSSSCSMGIE